MAVPVYSGPTPASSMLLHPAYTPDYQSLIKGSPEYLAYQAGNPTVSAGANRTAAIRALALQFGGALPAGFTDAYGDLSPDILAQARANPNSTMAQLARQQAASQQSLLSGLAARGALHSGDLVQGQQNLDTASQQALYDAGSAFGSH